MNRSIERRYVLTEQEMFKLVLDQMAERDRQIPKDTNGMRIMQETDGTFALVIEWVECDEVMA